MFFRVLGAINMFRNIFYMFLGAFIGLAFFAPDQFDDFRSSVQEAAGGAYAYASQSLTTLSEKSEAVTN